jgi:MoxR-like ATPase
MSSVPASGGKGSVDGAPAMPDEAALIIQIEEFRKDFDAMRGEVGKMIVGYREQVEKVLIALVVGGNVLLESVPGLGKTMLVHTLGRVLKLDFRRVQFTADLMPSDIIGTNVVDEDDSGQRSLHFQRGPLFTHLLLADEINRATPRTQSALLEAMEEHTVTVGGYTHVLEEPFFVMATQNPIEQAGTYPLPAAQLDKFLFKLLLGYPNGDELDEIVARTTQDTPPALHAVASREKILQMRLLARHVPAASHVQRHAAMLVSATHVESPHATEFGKRYIRSGSSPRGVLALLAGARVRALLEGRCQVSTDDVRAMAPATLRHRIIRSFEAQSDNIGPDRIIEDLLAGVSPDAAEVFSSGPVATT